MAVLKSPPPWWSNLDLRERFLRQTGTDSLLSTEESRAWALANPDKAESFFFNMVTHVLHLQELARYTEQLETALREADSREKKICHRLAAMLRSLSEVLGHYDRHPKL